DDVGEEDVLMEVFPTTRMEVRFALNETRVDRVTAGMPVLLAVPALAREDLRGHIDRISGIGEDTGEADHRDATGVRAFEGRVALEQTLPGFRPGMSVVLSVETDRRTDVLWLPRAALRDLRRTPDGQKWTATVLRPGPKGPEPAAVRGELFDATRFIITDGLESGDSVLLVREAAA
ncbi:MAG: HlyD family efflux transporter periplasmic adaptor subunit, partial [Planctomycetota bacterium]